jgi:hypothetical protein
MINANHLRPGNTVDQGRIYGVEKITCHQLNELWKHQNFKAQIADYIKHFEPALITHDWARKAGFREEFHEDPSEGTYFALDLKGQMSLVEVENQDGYITLELFFGEGQFKYIHEIENLYLVIMGHEIEMAAR